MVPGLGGLGTLEVGAGRPKTEGSLRPARGATSREVGPGSADGASLLVKDAQAPEIFLWSEILEYGK